MLDTEDFLQAPRIQALKEKMQSSQDEEEKKRFLISLVREILAALDNVTISKIENGVNVNNLDEVKASLRNELARANKPITDLLKQLNLSTQDQTKVMGDLESQAEKDFHNQYQTVVVRRVKDTVSVDNLHEVPLTEDVSVNNLGDLEKYFKGLEDTVKSALNINLPAPQVTVNPPQINIPETQVNVPPVNLNALLESLDDITQSLKKLKANDKSHPLAVRLTDGGDWIRDLIKVQKETSKAVAAFAGGANMVRILDPNMNFVDLSGLSTPTTAGSGKTTVTTAGTRVVLASSTAVNSVTIKALSANTGIIYVGNSAVASTNGFQLSAGESVSLSISNLSAVYIDSSVNSESVTYMWVK